MDFSGLLGNLKTQFTPAPEGQNSTFYDRFTDPKFRGLLAMLNGMGNNRPIGESVQAGTQLTSSLIAQDEEKKRKAAVQKLISEGNFTDQEKALLAASKNPIPLAVQIRNQKLPSSALGQLNRDLKLGNISQADYDARTNKLNYIAPPRTGNPNYKNFQFNKDVTIAGKDYKKGQILPVDANNNSVMTLFQPYGNFPSSGGTNVTVNLGPDGEPKPGIPNTEAVEDLNKKYNTELIKWLQNDSSDSAKLIDQLESVVTSLQSGVNVSGPIIGLIPDEIKAFTKSGRQAISTRENIEEVVQRNLKLILGGQFTEREGEKLVKRAFNPNLSEEENLKRATRLLAQFKSAAGAKQKMAEHFNKNGTLAGFDTSIIPTINDFNLLMDDMDGLNQDFASQVEAAKTVYDLDKLSQMPNLTSEDRTLLKTKLEQFR